MKNYFAKLRENEEKGFSLVELIIVMAIMAILVGVVASQVIPYMEKSRQAKDQQQLSGIATDITSAIASSCQTVNTVGTTTSGSEQGVKLEDMLTTGNANQLGSTNDATTKIVDEFCSLRDTSGGASAAPTVAQIVSDVKDKLKSKAANQLGKTPTAKKISDGEIYVIYDADKSKSTIFMSSSADLSNAVAKLTVESE